MPSADVTKKASPQSDWHRADIKAAIEKSGWSLRRLALAHGYNPKSLSLVLHTPWPKAEAIVADAIGVPAHRIWPSRYDRTGKPRSGRGERGLGRRNTKRSTARVSA